MPLGDSGPEVPHIQYRSMYMFQSNASWVIVLNILLHEQLYGPTQKGIVACLRILHISIWAERSSDTMTLLLDSRRYNRDSCMRTHIFPIRTGAYRLGILLRMDVTRDCTVWKAILHIKVEFWVCKSMP